MEPAANAKAPARGRGGTSPMKGIELTENSSIAQSKTRLSTSTAKLGTDKERNPQVTVAVSGCRGGTRIASRAAGESTSCDSSGANMESRPDIAVAVNIWT